MSPCTACRRGTAIPPGRPIPAGWRLVDLIERDAGPATGIYACDTCVNSVPYLATAAWRMASRSAAPGDSSRA